jgi:hypothetical protein
MPKPGERAVMTHRKDTLVITFLTNKESRNGT